MNMTATLTKLHRRENHLHLLPTAAKLTVGNVLPLFSMPEGTVICNIEEYPGYVGGWVWGVTPRVAGGWITITYVCGWTRVSKWPFHPTLFLLPHYHAYTRCRAAHTPVPVPIPTTTHPQMHTLVTVARLPRRPVTTLWW